MADLMKIRSDPICLNKAISAVHATTTSVIALLLLRYSSWPIPETAGLNTPERYKPEKQHLDDARNPTIRGRNHLANALTTWETVYLLYDTYAMIYARRGKSNLPTNGAALRVVAKESPVVLAHHVLLSSAFLVLQAYIVAGQERGLWVIIAFMLMNSSTPLMHARWWKRQQTGKPSITLDLAFLATFAASRFGVVVWILRQYGSYHGIGAWHAYTLLRKRCQIGTAMLVGSNSVWWTILAFNILKRSVKRRKS